MEMDSSMDMGMDSSMDMGMDISEGVDMDMGAAYPETMIVIITTHGEIQVETTYAGQQESDIFAIPYDITLTRINAVAPGVCNYLSDNIAKMIVDRIKELTAKFDLSRNIPSNLVTYLTKEFKGFANMDWQALKKQGYEDKEDILDRKTFHYNYDKIYKTITQPAYSFSQNKIYTIKKLSENYNDKIIFLNTPQGELDYFTTIHPPYKTDLKHIVYYLKYKGVKNILLIDLSCSAFNGAKMSARDKRTLQRESFREGWGGQKKKSKKNKCNKSKCNKSKCNKSKCNKNKCNKSKCNKSKCNKSKCNKNKCNKNKCNKNKCNKSKCNKNKNKSNIKKHRRTRKILR